MRAIAVCLLLALTLMPMERAAAFGTPLRGAPLRIATGLLVGSNRTVDFALPSDGRIVTQELLADPYPLTPTLTIRDISFHFAGEASDDQRGLLAATDDGIYIRARDTFRWRKFSDQKARFISTCGVFQPPDIFVTPDDAPDTVLRSTDNGATWVDMSAGLSGAVASRVHIVGECFRALRIVTEFNGEYVLWQAPLRQEEPFDYEPWQRIATLPARPYTNALGKLPVSMYVGEQSTFVGGSGGRLYRSIEFDENGAPVEPIRWEEVTRFGANTYPLLLTDQKLSLINLRTGEMQLQQRFPDDTDFRRWRRIPFAVPGAPYGIGAITNGRTIRRAYANNQALTTDGSLWRWINDEAAGGFTYQLVTRRPQRTEFVPAFNLSELEPATTLFSGTTLSFGSRGCAAGETGFWRSDDSGASWQRIATGAGREMISVLSGSPDTGAYVLLANTCAGPAISDDNGQTWRAPEQLGWPADLVARQLSASFNFGDAETPIVAAGVRGNGEGFVLQAQYSPDGTLGAWEDISPSGLGAPTALNVDQNSRSVHAADATGVWSRVSLGDGTFEWQRRSDGLGGAQVRALLETDIAAGFAILAMTDRGLFFAPTDDPSAPWIKTDTTYGGDGLSFVRTLFPPIWVNNRAGAYGLEPRMLFYTPSAVR